MLERLRGLPDDAARASEALRWVQDNIRYHAVLLGESSHRPRPVAAVLRDRYGDCKGKTLLLVSMLRALGVPADPVLASLRSRRGMAGVLPSPDVFDHAVVHVCVAGVDYFVDPTRTGQVGALARMGQSLEDAEVLLVRADSQGATLVRSPLRTEIFQHSVIERFTLDAFGEDGQLQMQMTLNGLDAEALRAALPQMDEAQRRQSMLSGYEKRYPGLQLTAAPAFLDVPADNQIRIVASYRIPNLARDVSGNWVMNFVPSNLRGSVFIPERITHRFPVLMPSYPGSVLYQVQMRWPESVAVVNDPRIRNVDSRFFRARIESSFRGREASRKVLFEALAPEVAARDLPTLIEDVRKLDREVTGVLVVGRDEIKRDGLLGIGRQSVMVKMRERLRLTVQGTTRAIGSGRLTGADLAEALCTRTEALADLEEVAKGVVDAEAAVKQVSEASRSWQCRADLDFYQGRFDASVAGYSRALAMGHEPFNIHYRRGMSRYYQGQLAQAADDFAKAVASQDDEADRLYARLWQVWTLRQLGRPLPEDLDKVARAQPRGAWPRPALALLTGVLTPEQILAEIEKKTGDEQHMAYAEGWFYLGQYHKLRGDRNLALDAFQKCRDRGMTVYIEHVAAGHELQALSRHQAAVQTEPGPQDR